MKGASLNKKVEGVSKSRSSSSSIMDDAGPPSLFALVFYFNMPTPYYSIVQLDHEYTREQMIKTKVVEKLRFNIPLPRYPQRRLQPWSFSPLKSSTEDLYMVPNWDFSDCDTVKPLRGYKFNFSDGSFLPIKLPEHYKLNGHLVNVRGTIYFMSHDWYNDGHSVFQCYDPVKELWEDLKPFPDAAACEGRIMATAVWKDTILFNVESLIVGSIWAYDVKVNEWYCVEFDDILCLGIVGEAVVIGDTIYALTEWSVLALSIKKEKNLDGCLVFECSILADNNMDPILFRDDRANFRSRHLVHLGKDDFCVVQSCYTTFGNDCQPIQVTHIKIEIERDHSMTVMDEYFHQVVKVLHGPFHNNKMAFNITLCFSLPNGATTPLKELKSFDLDSFESIPVQEEEDVDVKLDNDSSQTNFIDAHGLCQYARKLLFNATVYVRNLPPKATVRQLEKGLTKFGPIKSGGIRVLTSKRGKRVARVEFESYSSLQCAIEVSAIRIGDCQAEITEGGSTEFNPADCNWTQAVGSSSFGKNKLKNHGEVSRSKTTAVGTLEERGVYQPRRPKGFQDNDSSQTSILYVSKLLPDASVGQLEKGLKKYGPIKRDGIRVVKNKHGKVFASVEFESAASKRRAIKASTIEIGGCPAEMLEKRPGLADFDCNRTQAVGSSSSGKNNLKKHGEVSRSKMSCGGQNGGGGVHQPSRPKGVCK